MGIWSSKTLLEKRKHATGEDTVSILPHEWCICYRRQLLCDFPVSWQASSRTGSTQCHGQRLLRCFGDAVWLCPWLCKGVKTTEGLSRGLSSIIRPWLCRSMSVCPSLSMQHCLLTPPHSSSFSAGAASRAGKGMCTNPTLPGEPPHPKAEVCVSSLLPLSSVPLSVCRQPWGLQKYLWRNWGDTKTRTNPGYA